MQEEEQAAQPIMMKEMPTNGCVQICHPHVPVFGIMVILGLIIIIFMQTRVLKEMRKNKPM